ncbi:MAG: alpha/beta fold hydrolase [Candidatus Nanopelagicales bacterium]|nr:alpha/beta fold hydrolase [Candidatus Nanopelagicales bacterium]
MTESGPMRVRKISIHGHQRAYIMTGRGPVLLLLHGIGMNHKTWLPVIPSLAKNFTVIAPDMLGHGESDKPRADYSIGGFANGVRDLLSVLDIPSVTIVGHSLGGGVAMQFAYQYPQLTDRVVLVASGGLGRSVNPVIRSLTLPGSGAVLAAVTMRALRSLTVPTLVKLHRSGLPLTADMHGLAEVYDSLGDKRSRVIFRHVLRAAVDWRGQLVTMIDRAYLAQHMPSMVIWGARDIVIPVKHAFAANELLPGSLLKVFKDSGHLPHADEPERFAECLTDFVMDTPATEHNPTFWRDAIVAGNPSARARRRKGDRTVTLPRQADSQPVESSAQAL